MLALVVMVVVVVEAFFSCYSCRCTIVVLR